jgi:hypothetical protein
VREKVNKLLPFALVLVFALSRWPGVLPLNFSAAYALAFCGGLYFAPHGRWLPMERCWSPMFCSTCSTTTPLNGHGDCLAGFALIVALGRACRMHFLKLLGVGCRRSVPL